MTTSKQRKNSGEKKLKPAELATIAADTALDKKSDKERKKKAWMAGLSTSSAIVGGAGIGLMFLGPVGIIAGGVLLSTGMQTGLSVFKQRKRDKIDLREVGTAAAVGAATGAVAAPFAAVGAALSAGGTLVQQVGVTAATSSIGGGVSGAVGAGLSGERDPTKIRDAALVGALAGAAGGAGGRVCSAAIGEGAALAGVIGGAGGGSAGGAVSHIVSRLQRLGELTKGEFAQLLLDMHDVPEEHSQILWQNLIDLGILEQKDKAFIVCKQKIPAKFPRKYALLVQYNKQVRSVLDLAYSVVDSRLVESAIQGGITGGVSGAAGSAAKSYLDLNDQASKQVSGVTNSAAKHYLDDTSRQGAALRAQDLDREVIVDDSEEEVQEKDDE